MSTIPHGTYAGYKHHGCHCDPCNQARRDYENDRSRAIAYGTWSPWGDADAVRARITALKAAGWSIKAVATAARTTEDVVRNLGRDPGRRVRAEVAARILEIDQLWPAGYVPAVGSVRRLRALAVIGHGLCEVSAESGLSVSGLSKLRAGQRWTQARTPAAVEVAYTRLEMRPASSPRAGIIRERARAAGWAPPLAWDDIDDPDAVPDLGERVPRFVAIGEDAAELVALGYPKHAIAERLGVTRGYVTSALTAHHRRIHRAAA
ncbi:hypothetical protein GCM10023224_05560 [Streptomonospora halophila]|uniref:Uncharacterized protein n=1 Tax=Streptomonospora halophila TaxID=427369 RepID=A0ABP9G5P8_9ACTN